MRLCSPVAGVNNDSSRAFARLAKYLSSVWAAGRDLGYDALQVVSVVEQSSFWVQRDSAQLWLR